MGKMVCKDLPPITLKSYNLAGILQANNHKKIDIELWSEWQYNMIGTIRNPAFIAYWKVVKKNTYLEKEFIKFIDKNTIGIVS